MTDWSKLGTEGRADAIRAAWEPGIAASGIGAKIGVTRNAIIGMYTRHRSEFTDYPLQASVTAKSAHRSRMATSKPKSKPAPTTRPAVISSNEIAVRRPESMPAPSEAPEPRNVLLEHLRARQCRWPINDGGPFLFCGNATDAAVNYCPYHRRVNVAPKVTAEYRI